MAFENGNGMGPADMAALMRGGNNGWGNDGFGGWFVILFFLLCLGGGWNNGGWGNNGNGVAPATAVVGADIQRGFDQQATQGAIGALQAQVGNGFSDAAVARCSGDAAITQAITSGNAALTQAVTSGNAALTQAVTGAQYANSQAITGAKDVLAGSMNGLAMSLQNCCCENRAGLADLKYTVATENCQDRQVVSDGLRDVIAAGTANTQSILNGLNDVVRSQQQGTQALMDKLCQLELDSYKQKVTDLTAQVATLQTSAQTSAQTAAILANNEAQTANLLAQLNPPARPAYIVQNPNCCQPNFGCGCGA